MEVREESASERVGKEAAGGGSVRRSLSSFCIRRFNLAACAIAVLLSQLNSFHCFGFQFSRRQNDFNKGRTIITLGKCTLKPSTYLGLNCATEIFYDSIWFN